MQAHTGDKERHVAYETEPKKGRDRERQRRRDEERKVRQRVRGEGGGRGTMQRKLVALGFGSHRSCTSVNLIDFISDKPAEPGMRSWLKLPTLLS